MRIKVCSAVAVVLLLAGCGGPKPQVPSPGTKGGPPDTSNITISGDADDPVNKLATQGIADLEDFWSAQYPNVYGEDWKPVKGGYFAVYPTEGGDPRRAQTTPAMSPVTPSTARRRTLSHGMPRACCPN